MSWKPWMTTCASRRCACSAEKRVLITAHDAFNYFGKAYGFEVRGLQGISTASEAGTGDVQALTAFIVERQIPAIFVESSVPQRTIEAVRAAVRARALKWRLAGSCSPMPSAARIPRPELYRHGSRQCRYHRQAL
jgi:manganese/zinc/iron transport system substrate-binding protein